MLSQRSVWWETISKTIWNFYYCKDLSVCGILSRRSTTCFCPNYGRFCFMLECKRSNQSLRAIRGNNSYHFSNISFLWYSPSARRYLPSIEASSTRCLTARISGLLISYKIFICSHKTAQTEIALQLFLPNFLNIFPLISVKKHCVAKFNEKYWIHDLYWKVQYNLKHHLPFWTLNKLE